MTDSKLAYVLTGQKILLIFRAKEKKNFLAVFELGPLKTPSKTLPITFEIKVCLCLGDDSWRVPLYHHLGHRLRFLVPRLCFL